MSNPPAPQARPTKVRVTAIPCPGVVAVGDELLVVGWDDDDPRVAWPKGGEWVLSSTCWRWEPVSPPAPAGPEAAKSWTPKVGDIVTADCGDGERVVTSAENPAATRCWHLGRKAPTTCDSRHLHYLRPSTPQERADAGIEGEGFDEDAAKRAAREACSRSDVNIKMSSTIFEAGYVAALRSTHARLAAAEKEHDRLRDALEESRAHAHAATMRADSTQAAPAAAPSVDRLRDALLLELAAYMNGDPDGPWPLSLQAAAERFQNARRALVAAAREVRP